MRGSIRLTMLGHWRFPQTEVEIFAYAPAGNASLTWSALPRRASADGGRGVGDSDIEFNLGSRNVQIDAVHARRTYLGVMGGTSLGAINEGVLRRALPRSREMFSCDATHIIDPTAGWDTHERELKRLPAWEVYALVKSDWKPDIKCDGSQIVIIYYVNFLFSTNLQQDLSSHLSTLRWESEAEPYCIDDLDHYGGTQFG